MLGVCVTDTDEQAEEEGDGLCDDDTEGEADVEPVIDTLCVTLTVTDTEELGEPLGDAEDEIEPVLLTDTLTVPE